MSTQHSPLQPPQQRYSENFRCTKTAQLISCEIALPQIFRSKLPSGTYDLGVVSIRTKRATLRRTHDQYLLERLLRDVLCADLYALLGLAGFPRRLRHRLDPSSKTFIRRFSSLERTSVPFPMPAQRGTFCQPSFPSPGSEYLSLFLAETGGPFNGC